MFCILKKFIETRVRYFLHNRRKTDDDYNDAQSNRDPEEDIASQATAGVNDADDEDHDNDTGSDIASFLCRLNRTMQENSQSPPQTPR